MKQYILLIQGNSIRSSTAAEWDQFFAKAQASGLFKGGSEIGERMIVGNQASAKPTGHIAGYMRFDSDDRQKIIDLLQSHPVVLHGGSVELCEMPKS